MKNLKFLTKCSTYQSNIVLYSEDGNWNQIKYISSRYSTFHLYVLISSRWICKMRNFKIAYHGLRVNSHGDLRIVSFDSLKETEKVKRKTNFLAGFVNKFLFTYEKIFFYPSPGLLSRGLKELWSFPPSAGLEFSFKKTHTHFCYKFLTNPLLLQTWALKMCCGRWFSLFSLSFSSTISYTWSIIFSLTSATLMVL